MVDMATLRKLLGNVVKVETFDGVYVTGDFQNMSENDIGITLYSKIVVIISFEDIQRIVGYDEELSLPKGGTWIM
jgi:hypothetical protein